MPNAKFSFLFWILATYNNSITFNNLVKEKLAYTKYHHWDLYCFKCKKLYYLFYGCGCMPACIPCSSRACLADRRGCQIPWSESLQIIIESPCGSWESTLVPSEEQPVLLATEPSLQSLILNYTSTGLVCF